MTGEGEPKSETRGGTRPARMSVSILSQRAGKNKEVKPMSRECEGYRTTLVDILEYTNGARLLTKKTVAQYLGIDDRTAEKRFDITKKGIAATELARKLCKL